MTETLRISGGDELAALARDLKAAGNKDLRKEMLRGLRTAARPAVGAVRASAEAILPHTGGLAHAVATSAITTRTTTSARSAGVRVVATGKQHAHNIRRLDEGKLRHPVFGNRNAWVDQDVPPHWFTRPLEQLEPTVQVAMRRVLTNVARQLEQ